MCVVSVVYLLNILLMIDLYFEQAQFCQDTFFGSALSLALRVVIFCQLADVSRILGGDYCCLLFPCGR